MDGQLALWKQVMTGRAYQTLMRDALGQAASGLSQMVGQVIVIDMPRIEQIPLGELERHIGSLESQMVGIYLLIEGDMTGQALLLFTPTAAMQLAELLLEQPPTPTRELGAAELSALAEVGNLTVSLFLNKVAGMMGLMLYPSPPAVMVDMLGALMEVAISPLAELSNELLLVDTWLRSATPAIEVHLWLLPLPGSLLSNSQNARYG